MRKFAVLGVALALLSSTAFAQHVQGEHLTHDAVNVTVEGRVVGLGNFHGDLEVEAQVRLTCADGTTMNVGMTSEYLDFDAHGPHEFVISQPVGLMCLGGLVDAELLGVEVRLG